MNQNSHSELVGFIWKIADLLRGPYRPPQYRRVMLPMIVLRRMDCVLEDTKDLVLAEYEKLKLQGYSQEVIRFWVIKRLEKGSNLYIISVRLPSKNCWLNLMPFVVLTF